MASSVHNPVRLSEAELRDLMLRSLNSAPTGISISTVEDGRFIYVNDRFCTISGYTREQMIGTRGHDLDMWVNPADRNEFANLVRRDGRVEDLEYTFMRPNRERRVGRLSAELVMVGDRGCIVTSIMDVTEQRQARQQQQQSEARLRAMARAAPDLMLITSAQGRILEVLSEPEGEAYFGALTDTLRGAKLADVLPTSLAAPFLDALRRTLGDGRQQHIEYCVGTATESRWFEAVTAPIREDGEEISAIMWVARDITDRKRSEDATRRESERRRYFARQLINVQERERERIARELHDDLGQILTALKIHARHLIDNAESADLVREKGIEFVEHLSTAMDAIRDLAAGLRPGILDDLGLGPAFESLTERMAVGGTPKVTLLLDPAVERAASETKTALYRIGQEALTNVARHAQAAEVALTLTLLEDLIELKIVDDGCGISAGELEHPTHMGITSMRERAGLLGGRLTINQTERGGTEVVAVVPFQ